MILQPCQGTPVSFVIISKFVHLLKMFSMKTLKFVEPLLENKGLAAKGAIVVTVTRLLKLA